MHKYRIEFAITSPVDILKNLEKIVDIFIQIFDSANVKAIGSIFKEG